MILTIMHKIEHVDWVVVGIALIWKQRSRPDELEKLLCQLELLAVYHMLVKPGY